MPELSTLTFIWPRLLWLLVLVPCLLVAFLWLSRPRQAGPVPWMDAQAGSGPARRQAGAGRHNTGALLILAGLCLLLTGIARPQAVLLLPSRMDTVMLAVDTSGSMRATDVKPSRIEAAQEALRRFIEAQPQQVKVGVVTFSATASVAQPPTTSRDDLSKALENLQMQPGSAVGSAILIALAQLVPGSGIDVNQILSDAERPPPKDKGRALTPPEVDAGKTRAEPGSNKAAAIILITDGQGNLGPDPLKMAQLAAEHGVKVHTVGVGTTEGIVIRAQGVSQRVKLDETVLKKIAELTLGDYYRATSATDLQKVYDQLGLTIRMQKHQTTEISAILIALGMLLALCGAALTLYRSGRII